MTMVKRRADVQIVKAGKADSREQARQLIEQGKVLVGGRPVAKPASMIDEHSHIVIVEDSSINSYVSRGGLKLEKALSEFGIDPTGMNVIDIGASTGGFTDCLLRRGAKSVTAVDVGYGQLAWSLRNDPRVTVMERTNIRNVTSNDFEKLFDLATIDVSFISLGKILNVVVGLLAPGDATTPGNAVAAKGGSVVALIKPQFEAGRERVGKKGVVRDEAVHRDVLSTAWHAFEQYGMRVKGLIYSPIKGPEGNIEFFIYAVREAVDGEAVKAGGIAKVEVAAEVRDEAKKYKNGLIKSVVDEAHRVL